MGETREIVTLPTESLRGPSVPVSSFDGSLRLLIAEMCRLMIGAGGVGLAAPQVGVNVRLFVVDPRFMSSEFSAKKNRNAVFINPNIVSASMPTSGLFEGCLSIPGEKFFVSRSADITMNAFDADGREFETTVFGWDARVLQHELDHLDGILIDGKRVGF